MVSTGEPAEKIIEQRGLAQISDTEHIRSVVLQVLDDHTDQVEAYFNGKETLFDWFLGQVMRQTGGKANPRIVKSELEKQLAEFDN